MPGWAFPVSPRFVLGSYLGQFMDRCVEAWRFARQIVMWLRAWYHRVWLIPAGRAVVVAWMLGLWRNRSA